jgi:hypothetical protein
LAGVLALAGYACRCAASRIIGVRSKKTMLKKAIEVREKEGDEALSQWFNSLSDKDKNQFLEELDQASETMHAAFTNFREAVIEVFNKMFPHMESIVKALSEVLQNESGTTLHAPDAAQAADESDEK